MLLPFFFLAFVLLVLLFLLVVAVVVVVGVVHFDVDANVDVDVDVVGGLKTSLLSPHFCLYAAKTILVSCRLLQDPMKCKVFPHFAFSRKHQYLSRFTTDLHFINSQEISRGTTLRPNAAQQERCCSTVSLPKVRHMAEGRFKACRE